MNARHQRRRKALTLRTVPAQPDAIASTLLAKQLGFSLHATTVCEANQRDKLEKLCRYITRPAIANERLSTNERGQVIYTFKQPFRDGSTHVVLDLLDFFARLAALVPRPRLNLTRFHGVFAPNCKHRERIVPNRAPLRVPDTPSPANSHAQTYSDETTIHPFILPMPPLFPCMIDEEPDLHMGVQRCLSRTTPPSRTPAI